MAAGPTLLAVPITEQLYGGGWVAGAATAFSLSTLLSSGLVTAAIRTGLSVTLRWPLWDSGMPTGSMLAPAFASVGAGIAHAGFSLAAFEGDMDARRSPDRKERPRLR